MFCADQNWLPDGRLLTVGGTMYSNDPGNNQVRFGPTELQGLRNSRIFNPKNERWTQTGNMQEGRWYPTADHAAPTATSSWSAACASS